MIALRPSVLLLAAIACGVLLQPSRAQAQWWSRAPADFEECADAAEKAATREERTSQLTECNAKFAGRRKPGGGYSYFDFMQNRSFDIAGPNPTPQEQKYIDQQYTLFLDSVRQDRDASVSGVPPAAAPLPAPPSLQPLQSNLSNAKVPLPMQAPKRPAAIDAKSHAECTEHSFACDFPLLTERINDLKKLFGASQATDQAKNAAKIQARNQVRNPAKDQAKNRVNNQVNNDVKDKRDAVEGRSPM